MKFKAKSSNTTDLEFNDLGTVVRGVSPQQVFLRLSPGEAVYLPDTTGVLYSALSGDAKKFADHGYLEINDDLTLANTAALTVAHGFGWVPTVTVSKRSGDTWIPALAADVTIVTNDAKTSTVITNVSGGALRFYISVA